MEDDLLNVDVGGMKHEYKGNAILVTKRYRKWINAAYGEGKTTIEEKVLRSIDVQSVSLEQVQHSQRNLENGIASL